MNHCLNAQLFKQVLGDSLDNLDLLVLKAECYSHEQIKELLDESYPLSSGEPEIHAFAEVVDLTLLNQRRWPVVCLLWPDLTEDIDKPALTRLLARLRDLHAGRVIHIQRRTKVQVADPQLYWTMADSLALGFSQRTLPASTDANSDTDGQFIDLDVYEFDIRSYKPAPDWLNAKHWANPERWEKHRW